MGNTRTKNTTLSIVTSGIRQVSSILLNFVGRTVFIYVLGKEYLGLNGLFSNILSLLSLTELGIGVAITYYLYKPLATDDKERIKALMRFYRQCYNVVGIVIFVLGCSIMPFLDKIVNFDQPLPENLYVVYLLFLLQSACSYFFFAYKQSLITADQKLYKVEKINIIFSFLVCVVDILILLIFRSFLPYLIVKVALVIMKNLCVAMKVDKEYPYIKEPCEAKLTKEEIIIFFKDIYSVSVFKIGSVFLNSLTNILISVLISTAVVGIYSNYTLITSQVTTFYMLIITAVTAGVGNVLAKETIERQLEIFNKLRIYCFVICSILTICIFQLINSFISIWLGGIDNELVFPQVVVLFICLDFYLNTYSQINNTFRQASGNFKIGQYLQLIAGVVNVALAIPLCKQYGLVGIFAAQVISKLTITVIPFFYMIENKLFGTNFIKTLSIMFRDLILTAICGGLIWVLCYSIHMTSIKNFVVEAIASFTLPLVVYILIFKKTEAYKEVVVIFQKRIGTIIKK